MRIADLQVEVVRKNIRSLRLTVYASNGLVRVTVPMRTPDAVIHEFVVARRAWIDKHQVRFKLRARPEAAAYVSGETHYYQGTKYLLQVHATAGVPQVLCHDDTHVLDLYVREGSTREQRAKVLTAWYREQLKKQLPALYTRWQQVVGVHASEWSVKQMKTRWGTCNIQTKRIWLNLELIKKPTLCLEYVIVHELVHLHERLHNARFWGLMDHFMPEWRIYRDELQKMDLNSSLKPDAC